MPGRIPLESLAGIAWNPWPESNGITGRDHVESVAGIVWNLHPPPVGSDSTVDLPKIAGVTFEHRQGVILAMGEHLYDKKELLKAAGFQWDKTGKAWLKKAA